MKSSSEYLHGETLRSVSAVGLHLTETAYASDARLPVHGHESAYFCFVLEGRFTETYGRRSRFCRPSTLVFHPPGETHADEFHARARCFNIQVNSNWLERVGRRSGLINDSADFYEERLSALAAKIYREFLDADEFSALAIEGLTLEILAEASRRSFARGKTEPRPPLWLRQAREIIEERYGESLTLVRLSEAVGVHPVHFAREFRRFYGSTVGEFIRRRRVETACRLISTTDHPLADIALAAGFFDQSHFSRTLKNFTGLTPTEYRTAFRRPRRFTV